MSLAKWLSTAKEQYLLHHPAWTVVMGNEAADLDSIACSIAYAWILSTVHARPSIPLLRLAPPDLALRKENTHALALAAVPPSSLLFAPDFRPSPHTTFALVDHNRLAPEFTHHSPAPPVLAVVDHHADEGLYPDAAPRLVAPAGSCASHIAALCPPDLPPDLATLLLCAIAIDTGGARQGGKALAVDHAAVQFLAPRSTLAAPGPTGLAPQPPDGWLHDLTAALDAKKADVAALGAHDLLRRDYKQYALRPAAPLHAGLAVVPLPLAAWAAGGRLAACAARFMGARGLCALGVITSFRAGGAHRREQLWLVRADAQAEAAALWAGLEASAVLALSRDEALEAAVAVDGLAVRVYRQGNARATRKVTAPLLRAIFE